MLAGSAVMLTRSVVEGRAGLRSANQARAFYLGEAAVDLAIQALRTNPVYAGTAYTTLGNGLGGYSVEVAPDGPTLRVIRATGFYPSNDPAALGYSAKTIESVVQIAQVPGPGYGVLGDRSVQFEGWEAEGEEGMMLDSYDSRSGPYGSSGLGANVRLCTNEQEEEAIALMGQVTIRGDVVLGPGSDPEKTLWQMPKSWILIGGVVSVAETEAPVEPVDMPTLPDGGRLHISGHEVVTLPGGLYRFRGMHISGQGQLVFTGPVQVYVEEDVHISGNGITTADQLPPNLTLYVKGSHVSISGDADLFATLHAPYATIEISGNGDLYGALTGREVFVHGRGDIHYDEALNSYDTALNPPRDHDPLQVTTLSWRELDP